MSKKISIIIPTLNESATIKRTLDALRPFAKESEIIIVDGGSRDDTVVIAESRGAIVLHSPRGRGKQLQIGGSAAQGDVLWFVHADTLPAPDAVIKMKKALQNVRVVGGNYAIYFDGESYAARFLTWLYPQLRYLGLIYGDSAIFVRRQAYEKIGGFSDFPIFEDLDFIERLRRVGEIVTLASTVITSSRRFQGKSFILIFLRWMILQFLYWLGIPPEMMLKIYFPDFKSTDQGAKTS